MMPASNAKQISCKRCQKRKIRCSRTFPCINCSSASATCEFRDDGVKKYPISRDYVESLESRIAVLETFLAKLKTASPDQRDILIDSIAFLDHYQSTSDGSGGQDGSVLKPANDGTSREAAALVREDDNGSLTYHGPTSIYSGAFATLNQDKVQMGNTLPLPLTHSIDAGERIMCQSIALFFHWQYPQFMFIDREAFILDFQNRVFNGQFCSTALINAICSIGALMSTDSEVRDSAAVFAEVASSLLMAHGVATPHTTSVQTLLCCAYYEIGIGNLSKGWLYSGMAFRMGQDLGFQRDPRIWSMRNSTGNPIEEEYRRRIYWGCYISDKFFSLFFGRPCVMQESDADVRPSQPLPQDDIFNRWAEQRGLHYLKDQFPVVPRLTLVFNQQIEIGRIITKGLSLIHSPMESRTSQWSELAISEINAKLSKFVEDLPAEMRLKEWTSLSEPVQPHLAVLHMLYHSTRISLHRPFLRLSTSYSQPQSTTQSPSSILPEKMCTKSIERIVVIFKRFQTQHGLRHAPLIFVHGAITAINTILSLARCGIDMMRISDNTTLSDLESALQDMSQTWKIAGNLLNRLRILHHAQQRNLPVSLEARDSSTAIEATDVHMQVANSIPASIMDLETDNFGNDAFWNSMSLTHEDPFYWLSFQDYYASEQMDISSGMPSSRPSSAGR